jgi:PhnB protein
MKLLTQLNFPGNCAQAFDYYEKNLGGKLIMLMRQNEAPGSPKASSGSDPVIHARLALGETILLGNDVPPDRFQPMRSTYLYLAANSAEDAERIYEVLRQGGEVFMPLQETFYASRFSQLRDQFGVLWSLIHERAMPSA